MTRVLVEQDPASDVAALRAAWEDDATFAYLPQRAPLAADDVARILSSLPEPLRSGHVALLTSGSTGRPKLVIGARDRAAALARALHTAQDNVDCTQVVVALPLSYSFAFVNQWTWATEHCRDIVPTRGLAEPALLRAALERADDAMLCLVGVQAAMLIRTFPDAAFDGVTRLHFAGGRFPQELLGALARLFPRAQITNNYGCAEAMPRLTLRGAGESPDASDIGRPLPGIELRADDAGRLLFRSPHGAVAVHEGGSLRAIAPTDWIASGDLAEPAGDGWRLLGRANEIFKRHGEKVSLPAVLDTVGTAWSGETGVYRATDRAGEDGYVLVLAPSADARQVRGILGALRARHPRAQWPLRIEVAPALPRLHNGKLDHAALGRSEDRAVAWDQRI
jgi:acyl-CoA synthetase (AMP-forming)/AMP-acid ligase II